MDIQNKQELQNYLSYEEPINCVKLQFGENDENEEDKENNFKKSKIRDECGQIVNILVDKEQNSQLGSNISDTKSFYRANGLSKIETTDMTVSCTRDQLLKDWQDQKKSGTDSITLSGCKSPSNKYYSDRKGYLQNSVEKKEYLSQAQIMQKYFNSRIGYGDGKISAPVKGNTRPQSPKFQTTQRSVIHSLRNKQMEDMEQRSNSKNSAKKIDPKNFFLETERRAKSRPQTPIKEEEEFQFKARPKPDYKEFVVQKPEKQQIEFKEFALSTEDRGRSKEQQLKLKLENEKKQEELQRQFHAQQIPDYNELAQQYQNYSCGSPKPTLPMDIKFKTDQRAELGFKKSQLSQSAEKYAFKARKMPDFSKARSPAKPSPKKATLPVDMKLYSTQRAEERKLFDSSMEIQIKQSQTEQSYIEQNQKAKEEEEAENLRQQSQFKAQPIKKYKPVEIKKDVIPLTIPLSPKFKVDQRMRSTEKSNELL